MSAEHSTAGRASSTRRNHLIAAAATWLVATAQFLAVQLAAQSVWPTSYSWAGNNISDLGNVTCRTWDGRPVCSPWHAVMNASFVVTGVLIIVGVVLLCAALRRRPRTAHWLLMVAASSWVLVGARPADVDVNPHLLGAFGVLVIGNIGLVLLVRTRSDPFPGRRSAWTGLGLGVLGLAGAVLFATRTDLGLGGGGMERVAAYGLPVWLVIAACAILVKLAAQPATPGSA